MKSMMNHLSEIIHDINSADGITFASDEFMNDILKYRDFFKNSLSWHNEAIAFNIGDFENIEHKKPIKELLILPFQTCWFEFSLGVVYDPTKISSKEQPPDDWILVGGLVRRTGETEHEAMIWKKQEGEWSLEGWEILNLGVGPKWAANETVENYLYIYFWSAVYRTLSAINCSNVDLVEHKPSKLRLSRAKRNNLPIFSTWTLRIRPSKKGGCNGGTHASPRVHLRRGHIRQYLPGKYIWVQPCVVGNSKGIISKDYKI